MTSTNTEHGNILRTPEARFSGLPDFPFRPHYAELPDARHGSLRMHYLDEGPANGPVVLCLHGQGCWSYIYRHVVPGLVAAGYRAIVPDYIGFGRSDKLRSPEDYAFADHVGWLAGFIEALDLRDVTGMLFDWGGFFGLRIAGENPEVFSRIVLSNTSLPTGNAPGREWFIKWRAEQFALPKFPQGEMVASGTHHALSPETVAAYDAPYPDESYKAAPRRFPMILPIMPDDPAVPANLLAWQQLAGWNKPVLCLYSASFRGTAMGPERILAHIPGTRGQAHAFIEEAGFYLVEDQPRQLAARLIEFIGR